jgi:XTP/dITP diphosphohydrolase
MKDNHLFKLLLASNNPGKLREMRALLEDMPLELVTPQQAGLELEVAEDGSTYAENASRKALAFARAAGMLTLADDSGLEVAALGGEPGLYSARYMPKPGATDADRRAYLLQKLRGLPRPWLARFRCTVALADPAGRVQFAEGACPGEIIPQERGQDGFGYDPIFLLPELGRTMAELTMQEKNRLSHRARAVLAARPLLTQWSGPEK